MQSENIEPELKSLLTKLTVEIDRDSKEIEHLNKRIEKNEALLRAVKGSLGALRPEDSGTGYGNKRQAILEAIDHLGKQQFTQDEVESALQQTSPEIEINRDRIRSALWTMATEGKIRQTRKGSNQQPALYERIDASGLRKPAPPVPPRPAKL